MYIFLVAHNYIVLYATVLCIDADDDCSNVCMALCVILNAQKFVLALPQEYVPGKTLRQLMEEGWRPQEPDVINIALKLLSILEYLASKRPPVIHG